jgi:hypothetical protein
LGGRVDIEKHKSGKIYYVMFVLTAERGRLREQKFLMLRDIFGVVPVQIKAF